MSATQSADPTLAEAISQLTTLIKDGNDDPVYGAGIIGINPPYNPDAPSSFGSQIKELVSQAIAAGVAKYISENIPQLVAPTISQALTEAFKYCTVTVEVKDDKDKVIGTGTGTITYTPPTPTAGASD